MRGETRRKARRCIHRRSIAARIAAKTTGAAAQGAGERPRPRAPRRTPEGAMRGHGRGRSGAEPSKTRRVAQDCDPKAYMYTPSGRKDAVIGRLSRASTVAPTVTAHWKANQHEATTARHRIFHTKRRGDRLEKNWGKGGATDWDRTSNLRLRRPTLYPIELQSRWSSIIPNITAPRCRFFALAPP